MNESSVRTEGPHRTHPVRPANPPALGLRPGELARVRSAAEIFSTLDEDGTLDGVPFMPEMVKYCGQVFPVAQRADKTCAGDGVVRRMHNTVHLRGLRCDGSAHGGCQAACLVFWKEAWLERIENDAGSRRQELHAEEESFVANTLHPATTKPASSNGSTPAYRCQATEIPRASTELRFREVDQYVSDVRNWNLRKVLRGLVMELFNLWQAFSLRRLHLPNALLIAGGRPYPFVKGELDTGATPSAKLDVRPGDFVRVKGRAEIEATLDVTNNNRGLSFDPEMVKHCGRTACVRARVNRLIDERTGEMIEIKSDCIILEGVVCESDYHRFCPRGIYPYWREIWLEPIVGHTPGSVGDRRNGTA